MFRRTLLIFIALFSFSCTQRPQGSARLENAEALRPLTANERAQDFDVLTNGLRQLYGPLAYKEKRYGFKYQDLVDSYRVEALASKDDAAFSGVIKKFLTRFQDGHIGITFGLEETSQYSVPLVVTMIEDRVIIAAITEPTLTTSTGLAVGDEVLEVDGQPATSYLKIISQYEGLGNDLTDKHMIIRLFQRPVYITEMRPIRDNTILKVAKPDGTTLMQTLAWKLERGGNSLDRKFVTADVLSVAYADSVAKASVLSVGAAEPFFLSTQVEQEFQITTVKPSEAFLKKHGLKDMAKTPDLFAGLYRFEGKMLLLVRQPTYQIEDKDERVAWYKAVLDEYGRLADVLVLDQTHNPGGDMFYAEEFLSIFARSDTRGNVNFLHADRQWLSDLFEMSTTAGLSSTSKNILELGYKYVESAYDKGLWLTEQPISLVGSNYVVPAAFTFKKPILMLVDELSGSCGDIIPKLMKENGIAMLFGERTMGLGGNVAPVLQLPQSLAKVNLTRGLFMTYQPSGKYDFDEAIENNGVKPDIHYSHTVSDFRAGYVDYVKAFSTSAVELVKSP